MTDIDPAELRRARYAAAKLRWSVIRGRTLFKNGLQLLNFRNEVIAGEKFDLTPQNVIELTKKAVYEGLGAWKLPDQRRT